MLAYLLLQEHPPRAVQETDGADDGAVLDRFTVTPNDKVAGQFFRYNNASQPKQHNAANFFPFPALQQSNFVQLVWRVSYNKDNNEIDPKRPLYFPKHELVAKQGDCFRVV